MTSGWATATYPEFTKLLTDQNFVVTEQARMSPELLTLPLPPIFQEKDRAGLDLYDDKHQLLYTARSVAQRVYANFDAGAKIVAGRYAALHRRPRTARNRTSQKATRPSTGSPARPRRVRPGLCMPINPSPGAPERQHAGDADRKISPLPGGRTASAHEKLQQMQSASIRAYLRGEDTTSVRRQTVVAYLNTVPLTAKAGYGEINGIGDGLWAWYGRDFDDVQHALSQRMKGIGQSEQLQKLALAYKENLADDRAKRCSAFDFLREGAPALMQMTNNHLRLLAPVGIISSLGATASAALEAASLNQGDLAGTLRLLRLAQGLHRAAHRSLQRCCIRQPTYTISTGSTCWPTPRSTPRPSKP